jgi:hypothetical protein
VRIHGLVIGSMSSSMRRREWRTSCLVEDPEQGFLCSHAMSWVDVTIDRCLSKKPESRGYSCSGVCIPAEEEHEYEKIVL